MGISMVMGMVTEWMVRKINNSIRDELLQICMTSFAALDYL